jgi:hypothetical protein
MNLVNKNFHSLNRIESRIRSMKLKLIHLENFIDMAGSKLFAKILYIVALFFRRKKAQDFFASLK